jgi:hypothetical protein
MGERGAAKGGYIGDRNFDVHFTCPGTFSNNQYFKTVHLGGDDVIRQEQEDAKKELDDWKNKVVVDNPVFNVNTRRPAKPNQIDKHKIMLKDQPKKIGYRLAGSRLKSMAERNILATKKVENMPSTIFVGNDWEAQNKMKSTSTLKVKNLNTFTSGKDFDTNIRNDTLSFKQTSTKVFIQPVGANEKQGGKWSGQGVQIDQGTRPKHAAGDILPLVCKGK